jgi:hypothetical protein
VTGDRHDSSADSERSSRSGSLTTIWRLAASKVMRLTSGRKVHPASPVAGSWPLAPCSSKPPSFAPMAIGAPARETVFAAPVSSVG